LFRHGGEATRNANSSSILDLSRLFPARRSAPAARRRGRRRRRGSCRKICSSIVVWPRLFRTLNSICWLASRRRSRWRPARPASCRSCRLLAGPRCSRVMSREIRGREYSRPLRIFFSGNWRRPHIHVHTDDRRTSHLRALCRTLGAVCPGKIQERTSLRKTQASRGKAILDRSLLARICDIIHACSSDEDPRVFANTLWASRERDGSGVSQRFSAHEKTQASEEYSARQR